jgi:hypothetical protein
MGLFGSAGLKSAASSVAQILAALVGQDIVAKSITTTGASSLGGGRWTMTGGQVGGGTFTIRADVDANFVYWSLPARFSGNVRADGTLTAADSFILASFTDDSANPGNRTVNTVRGKSAFAIGAAAVTITNSFVTANSQVICTLEFGDATLTQILRCIPGAGSFVATGNANATAATKFSWTVIN